MSGGRSIILSVCLCIAFYLTTAKYAPHIDSLLGFKPSIQSSELPASLLVESETSFERVKTDFLFLGDGAAQWAMVGISFLALAISVGALIFLRGTLVAAKNANAGFAKASDKQLRAYLSATPLQFGLKTDFSKDQPYPVHVKFKVGVKNHGQTPAHGVRVWSAVGLEPWPLAVETVEAKAENLTHNAVINPGEVKEFSFDKDVLFHSQQLWTNPPHTFVIFGIVRYTTLEGDKFTRFCGGLAGVRDWYLHARNGDVRAVDFIHTEHSNDAD